MPRRPTTTTTACWDAEKQKLQLKVTETDDIRGRKFRAKEVAETYEWMRTINGGTFNSSLEVWLLPDCVGCTCQDMQNRKLPCKHVFAAAYLLGDAEALSHVAPTKSSSSRSAADPHRKRMNLRPQDIRVGRYFLLSDFLFSDTALKEGIRNWLDFESEYGIAVLQCMEILCERLLDPICDEFGRISVTRGYLGEQVYARLYPRDKVNWIKGALAHGFQATGGADIQIHAWEGTALELAKHIQRQPERYQFDFIRTYPESPILCVGVGQFKNGRIITEWQNNFAGSITHRPPKV